jgi:hypothetical protein
MCIFTFYTLVEISDYDIPIYADGDAAKQKIAEAVERWDTDKQHFIDIVNATVDGETPLQVEFKYTYDSLTESAVTAYGKSSSKALPSLYVPDTYLLKPGKYVTGMYVETSSGNVYEEEYPFDIIYTPMPDPLGMFNNVGIKGAKEKGSVIEAIPGTNAYKSKAYRLELIDVLGRTLKYVEGPEKPLTIEEAGAYYLRAREKNGRVTGSKGVVKTR